VYHEEQVFLLFSTQTLKRYGQTAIVPNYRYGFPQNQIIQKGVTRKIFYYQYYCSATPPVSMMPVSVVISNIAYTTMTMVDAPYVLITLVNRRGGYFCQDLPLYRFIQLATFRDTLLLEQDLDFSKSYVKFTQPPITQLPFVVPINFQMWNTLRADKNPYVHLPTPQLKHK